MTVLVGVHCKDGVVIGSDSAATFVAGQVRTIEQETRKIEIIGEHVIVAGTGQVGLGQRFVAIIKKFWDDKVFEQITSPIEMGKQLSRAGIEDFAFTRASMGQYGALVAFPLQDAHYLVEFAPQDFQPELKTKKLWYVSMGGGQSIADPFLGLMREVFWKTGPTSLQDSTFMTVWAIQHAIEVNPGGVNKPIEIAVLGPEKGPLEARMLEEHEIEQHLENVDGAKAHLADYPNILRGKRGAPDVPKPKNKT